MDKSSGSTSSDEEPKSNTKKCKPKIIEEETSTSDEKPKAKKCKPKSTSTSSSESSSSSDSKPTKIEIELDIKDSAKSSPIASILKSSPKDLSISSDRPKSSKDEIEKILSGSDIKPKSSVSASSSLDLPSKSTKGIKLAHDETKSEIEPRKSDLKDKVKSWRDATPEVSSSDSLDKLKEKTSILEPLSSSKKEILDKIEGKSSSSKSVSDSPKLSSDKQEIIDKIDSSKQEILDKIDGKQPLEEKEEKTS